MKPFCASCPVPPSQGCFNSAGGIAIPSPCECLARVLLTLLSGSFLAIISLHVHMWSPLLCWKLLGMRPSSSILYQALSSEGLCSANSRHCGLTGLSAFSLQFREVAGLQLRCPVLPCAREILDSSWDRLFLGDYSPWKPSFHRFCPCFASGGRVSLITVTSPGLKGEVPAPFNPWANKSLDCQQFANNPVAIWVLGQDSNTAVCLWSPYP